MNLESIDTNALAQELEKLKNQKVRLENLLDELKKTNNEVKDFWNSKTCNSVLENFELFYKDYQIRIDDLKNDIDFLEKTIASYHEYEEKTNKVIDENIAI